MCFRIASAKRKHFQIASDLGVHRIAHRGCIARFGPLRAQEEAFCFLFFFVTLSIRAWTSFENYHHGGISKGQGDLSGSNGCLACSPEHVYRFFLRICLGIMVGIFGSLFVVSVPRRQSAKSPRKIRGNSGHFSEQKSGRKF